MPHLCVYVCVHAILSRMVKEGLAEVTVNRDGVVGESSVASQGSFLGHSKENVVRQEHS